LVLHSDGFGGGRSVGNWGLDEPVLLLRSAMVLVVLLEVNMDCAASDHIWIGPSKGKANFWVHKFSKLPMGLVGRAVGA